MEMRQMKELIDGWTAIDYGAMLREQLWLAWR
jgi:hypothetical protein